MVMAEQAEILRLAIANNRNAKNLMKAWEAIAERLMVAEVLLRERES